MMYIEHLLKKMDCFFFFHYYANTPVYLIFTITLKFKLWKKSTVRYQYV